MNRLDTLLFQMSHMYMYIMQHNYTQHTYIVIIVYNVHTYHTRTVQHTNTYPGVDNI